MKLAITVITILTAVGTATAGGALLTFSTFTIGGLKALPPSDGVAAMQSINQRATTPLFMLVLFGTGLACILLGVHSIGHFSEPAARLRLIASAVYLVGVVGPTITYHVPRNDRLAALDPHSTAAINYWKIYLSEWVSMNHIRTLAAVTAAVLLTTSLALSNR